MTFAAAISNYLDHLIHVRNLSHHSVTAYGRDLEQSSSYVNEIYEVTDLSLVSHQMLRSWLADLKSTGISDRSLNRKVSSLRSFFKYCLSKSLVTKDPTEKVVAPKMSKRLPSYIIKDEMNALLEGLHERAVDYVTTRDYLIIKLLYATGMRRAELLSLKDNDVLISRSSIKVLGKGGKERIIPLANELLNEVRDLQSKRDEEIEDHASDLFVDAKGQLLGPRKLYSIVKTILSRTSSSDKKSPHVLRHSFATNILNEGGYLMAVKDLLGHANLAATQVYTHNNIERLKEIYKQFHPKSK